MCAREYGILHGVMQTVKKSDILQWFPKRKPDSRKGDNGRVLIVGGSIDFYGAPILAALGALYSGADLVHICVPECNFEVTRSIYPDFIVHSFQGNYLNVEAVPHIEELALRAHALLIGPGMGDKDEGVRAVTEIVTTIDRPIVLDADAISAVRRSNFKQKYVTHGLTVTPHDGEFLRLTDKKMPDDFDDRAALVAKTAKHLGINILLKGPKDLIASSDGEMMINQTGNAGMTVGGTGDVLAGVVAGFIAQGLLPPYYACLAAAHIVGLTGDRLFTEKGYSFSATDLALEIPFVLHKFLSS